MGANFTRYPKRDQIESDMDMACYRLCGNAIPEAINIHVSHLDESRYSGLIARLINCGFGRSIANGHGQATIKRSFARFLNTRHPNKQGTCIII